VPGERRCGNDMPAVRAAARAPGSDGRYDGGHGADQPPESPDRPGFAGDVDAGVRSGKDEAGQGLGGRGDGDVRRCRWRPGGDRPPVAVAFGQIVRTVEMEVPARWLVVAAPGNPVTPGEKAA
jgi:hypothetical protein